MMVLARLFTMGLVWAGAYFLFLQMQELVGQFWAVVFAVIVANLSAHVIIHDANLAEKYSKQYSKKPK